MGVPATEEESGEQASSPSTFAPELSNMINYENDSGFIDIPRKKKIFSSSSFYEEPNAIYPTMEEQVEMCRKIADSLSDDCNKKSKGANMFFKRVKRAEKWVVPSSAFGNDSQMLENMDPASLPYVKINKEPPKLKLILDPRHIIDLKQLREEGIQIVEHNAASKNLCQNIVNDLNSPTGKGAQLFAKRKKKSLDWVVDEEKVREHLKQVQDRERGIFTPEPPQGMMSNFIRPEEVAETVIRAAETKIMSYPTPWKSAIEPVHYYAEPAISVPPPLSFELPEPSSIFNLPQQDSMFNPPQQNSMFNPPQQNSMFNPPQQNSLFNPPQSPAIPPIKAGIYTCRGPRGWASPTPSRPVSMLENKSFELESLPELTPEQPQPPTDDGPSHSYPVTRTFSLTSFNNFNYTPKAWTPTNLSEDPLAHVKKVRPPSLVVQ